MEQWVKENKHNPEYKFVVGNRAFTPEEIIQNIKKKTPEGEKILEMITDTAVHLFLRPRG